MSVADVPEHGNNYRWYVYAPCDRSQWCKKLARVNSIAKKIKSYKNILEAVKKGAAK